MEKKESINVLLNVSVSLIVIQIMIFYSNLLLIVTNVALLLNN